MIVTYGQRLQIAMILARNMSEEELAQKTGLSVGSILRYEMDKTRPSKSIHLRLVEAINEISNDAARLLYAIYEKSEIK